MRWRVSWEAMRASPADESEHLVQCRAVIISRIRMDTPDLQKRLAVQLGYAGLLPFFLLMLGVWFADVSWIDDFVKGQLVYAIVILSFLGGLHWGAAMLRPGLTEKDMKKALSWGVTPSLIAWGSTLFGGFGFAVLMAGFVAALQVDKQLYPLYDMPGWMLALRKKLTIVVVLTLMATVIGANLRG